MNTGPRILVASSKHLDLLAGLAAGFRDHLGGSTPSTADLATSIRSLIAGGDAEFLIAVAEEDVGAGFLQVRYRYSMWLSALEAHLEDLFVVPNHRRSRLGTRLVQRALERAEQRGCASVAVDTNERNLPATSLYRRLGFSNSSNRWDGGQQLWFRKPLGR